MPKVGEVPGFPEGCRVMMTRDARLRFPSATRTGAIAGYGIGGSLRVRHDGLKVPVTWSAEHWQVDFEAEVDRRDVGR